MITLQEDPLIQWDETKPSINDQSQEAINWVTQNILNTTPVNTMETIHSIKEDMDWDRIKSQAYSAEGFSLVVERTYESVESGKIAESTYTLTTI